ncbi:MAG: MASE3 domain-containing protein [Methanoregula sp.]|nr:MASE3 domain-containing protein [Methanoregula sp.]
MTAAQRTITIDRIRELFLPATIVEVAVALFILLGLYLISTLNFLLFHGIVELAGIAVAFSIFIIIWNTRRVITDAFFLIVGISFLFIGIIDLVHTLAYKGMGVFPGNNPDLPTQLWIAARYFQSIGFLAATFFIGRSITRDRKYDTAIIIAACTAACALIFASIFVWQNFPHCFIEGSGLTLFKIASEYIISLILVATIIILYRKREHFDPTVWKFLIAAQLFLILGELAFTSYISVYGFMNLLGHLFRLISVYLFYRAFVVISLTRPYDLILRELKTNEDALRTSEQRYRITLAAVNDGLWEWNIPTGNAFFSEHYYSLLGYSPNEFPATYASWREYVHPEDLASVEEQLQDHIHNGIGFAIDLRMKTKEGQWKWVSTRGTVVETDLSGDPVLMAGTLSDITGRKRVEDEVRKARDFYLKVLDDFPNPVWRADIHGKCDYFNRDWLEFTGRTFDQELGDGWTEGVHKDDLERCLKIYLDNFNARKPFEMEYRLRYHDGTYHWLSDFGKPFYTSDGVFAGYIGSCYDIQGRRIAEEALRQVNKKLNLLSSITRHDINNQLFSLKAFLELSKESLGDVAQTSEYIIKEERAANAIERQIIFTKEYQDLGVKDPAWQAVDACVKKAQALLPMRDIRVEAELSGCEVYADPLFEKVFYNLIDNALRYGGQKMTLIRISSQESEAGLVISVEDDGVGISADDKKRLFERGFGHHTGLGLFLSREILSITGITITETSEPGKGARFGIFVMKGGYRYSA